MATDSPSPSPQSVRKNASSTSSTVSPAQAIADAWKRESLENQEKWRRIDADVKTRFNTPRKPDRKSKM